jgi:hypothetical protein
MTNDALRLARDYTDLVMDGIKREDESPTRPRNPVMTGTSIRLPIGLLRKLKRAKKKTGIDQTRLMLRAVEPLLDVLLEEQGIAEDNQGRLLDD